MKFLSIIFIFVFLSSCSSSGSYGPSIKKETISSDIPQSVRREIEGLYSSDVDEVFGSLSRISRMRSKAKDAIPFLISMLSTREIGYNYNMGFKTPMPVGVKAAQTLVFIGDESWEPMLKEIAKPEKIRDPYFRGNAGWFLYSFKNRAKFPEINGKPEALAIIKALNLCVEAPSKSINDEMDMSLGKDGRGRTHVYVDAVRKIGDKRAVPVLKKISGDHGVVALSGARDALKKMGALEK